MENILAQLKIIQIEITTGKIAVAALAHTTIGRGPALGRVVKEDFIIIIESSENWRKLRYTVRLEKQRVFSEPGKLIAAQTSAKPI